LCSDILREQEDPRRPATIESEPTVLEIDGVFCQACAEELGRNPVPVPVVDRADGWIAVGDPLAVGPGHYLVIGTAHHDSGPAWDAADATGVRASAARVAAAAAIAFERSYLLLEELPEVQVRHVTVRVQRTDLTLRGDRSPATTDELRALVDRLLAVARTFPPRVT
jgi:hypothetical protein